MILINLLPHREERRKRRKAAFYAGLGLAAAVGAGVVALWYGVLQQMISTQQARNEFLIAETRKLEAQIKDIATLKAEIDALKARQTAVENLQLDRNVPVHILNELVRQTPEGVYFTSLKQEGQVLNITGITQTNERMSEFLRNTGNNSEWLTRPELVEIKLSNAQTTAAGRDQRKLFDFTMRISVKRQADQPGSAASAASAPAPAGTATASR
ncbi:PilN domain-containing protein [Piscinibacter sakaiensis]|uniref:Type IV pilus biogenesis protein PilN n=1 Tax=Piscinibacter sakaiensis TaxID=1547922 RepID=A0A0K8NWM2_PISS1|nr:PilN domain-containing protein [Piscinibacter sakaiensis]GAP34802.1 type IV pilus biogenesis protein PilN [Piscinibacter sakaiensis]